jgi:hypothetical protein
VARLRWISRVGVAACVAVLAAGCQSPSAAPSTPAPGVLTVSPSAWPNPNTAPEGPAITTGLVVDGKELVIAFSHLPTPARTTLLEGAWLERATGSLTLVRDPGWGWQRPAAREPGLQAFTQVVTDAGLLEYGWVAADATKVTIECAGEHVDAGVGPWAGGPAVVAFWSLRDGTPTRHDSPESARPVVTVQDGSGKTVDRQVLTEPKQRTDG